MPLRKKSFEGRHHCRRSSKECGATCASILDSQSSHTPRGWCCVALATCRGNSLVDFGERQKWWAKRCIRVAMLLPEGVDGNISTKHNETMLWGGCLNWRADIPKSIACHVLEQKSSLARSPRLMLVLILLCAGPRAENTKHHKTTGLPVASLWQRYWLVFKGVATMPTSN